MKWRRRTNPVYPPAPQGPYVFISYARKDRECAAEIAEALRSAGVETIYDSNLKPGEAWVNRLHALIEGCFALVVLMTPKSTKSSFVANEILVAQTTHKLMLPVLIRNTHNLL